MTSSQNPPPDRPKTAWGQKTEAFLEQICEPIDIIGSRLMGSLWRTFYETVQDAITLSLLLHVPGLIGQTILGKNFSGFDVCLEENWLSLNRYACFIIVGSDFFLWFILAGRMIGRFLADLSNLRNSGRGRNGSN